MSTIIRICVYIYAASGWFVYHNNVRTIRAERTHGKRIHRDAASRNAPDMAAGQRIMPLCQFQGAVPVTSIFALEAAAAPGTANCRLNCFATVSDLAAIYSNKLMEAPPTGPVPFTAFRNWEKVNLPGRR